MKPASTCRVAALLVVALLAPGCADAIDPIGAARQALTDVPDTEGGHELPFEVSNGDQRAILLYLPAGYDPEPAEPYPVVAMFHGLGGSASDFADKLDDAGMRDLADDQGKIVVFFQGTLGTTLTQPGAWNVGSGGRDDVLYVQEVLDDLADELPIDTSRVFAGGHSLGGRFVHELGTRDPTRFRAIADVSGFYGTPAGQPAPPPAGTLLPVLIVHGTADPIVPLGGSALFLPTQDTYGAWYANDGCTEPTLRALSQYWDLTRTSCRPGQPGAVVQMVVVGGLNHDWPVLADHYDASSEMLAFFDAR